MGSASIATTRLGQRSLRSRGGLSFSGVLIALAFGLPTTTMSTFAGVTVGSTSSAMSSRRSKVLIDSTWLTTVSGKSLVAECPASDAKRRVLVYGDSNGAQPYPYPSTVTLLATLNDTTHSAAIGKAGDHKRYRVVAINATGTAASPSMAVRVIIPHISAVSPTEYPPMAQDLTISGYGFGSATGTATIGGVPCSVLSWSDTSVRVRADLTSFSPGTYAVQLRRADGVPTDTAPFTVL